MLLNSSLFGVTISNANLNFLDQKKPSFSRRLINLIIFI